MHYWEFSIDDDSKIIAPFSDIEIANFKIKYPTVKWYD